MSIIDHCIFILKFEWMWTVFEQLASWLFFPRPENDYFREMHYLRGFVQIQDLIERAVNVFFFSGKESAYVNYFILPILSSLM